MKTTKRIKEFIHLSSSPVCVFIVTLLYVLALTIQEIMEKK